MGHLNISYSVSSLITQAINRKTSLDYNDLKIGSKTFMNFITGQDTIAMMSEDLSAAFELSIMIKIICAVHHICIFAIRFVGGLLPLIGPVWALNQSVLMNTNPF